MIIAVKFLIWSQQARKQQQLGISPPPPLTRLPCQHKSLTQLGKEKKKHTHICNLGLLTHKYPHSLPTLAYRNRHRFNRQQALRDLSLMQRRADGATTRGLPVFFSLNRIHRDSQPADGSHQVKPLSVHGRKTLTDAPHQNFTQTFDHISVRNQPFFHLFWVEKTTFSVTYTCGNAPIVWNLVVLQLWPSSQDMTSLNLSLTLVLS